MSYIPFKIKKSFKKKFNKKNGHLSHVNWTLGMELFFNVNPFVVNLCCIDNAW